MFRILGFIVFIFFMMACSDLNVNDISCYDGDKCPADAICADNKCVLESDGVKCKKDDNCKGDDTCNLFGECVEVSDTCVLGHGDCDQSNHEVCVSGGALNSPFSCQCNEAEGWVDEDENGVCELEEECQVDCHGHGNCVVVSEGVVSEGDEVCECTEAGYEGPECNTCSTSYYDISLDTDSESNCVPACSNNGCEKLGFESCTSDKLGLVACELNITNNCLNLVEKACGDSMECDSSTFKCELLTECELGEKRCTSDLSYVETCNADGTNWTRKECTGDKICIDDGENIVACKDTVLPECVTNGDCTTYYDKTKCLVDNEPMNNICVECLNDGDKECSSDNLQVLTCDNNHEWGVTPLNCESWEICEDTGSNVSCNLREERCTNTDISACPEGKKNCDMLNHTCVQCLDNNDCPDEAPYCSPIDKTCKDEEGVCESITCTSDGGAITETNFAYGTCKLSDTEMPGNPLPECFCEDGFVENITTNGVLECISNNDTPCGTQNCGEYGACKLDNSGTSYKCICELGYSDFNGECRKLGIFVTDASWNGNLGGISGADAKCNDTDDENKPDDGRYYKALLGLSGIRQEPSINWPLEKEFSYYRAGNKVIKIGTTSDNSIFNIKTDTDDNTTNDNNLNNSILESEDVVTAWTGLTGGGNVDVSSNDCNGWASNTNAYYSLTGNAEVTDYNAIGAPASYCDIPHHLYCVEQVCPQGYAGDACDACDITGGYTMLNNECVTPPYIDDMTMGGYFTCIIKGGRLYCWGINSDGQLGIGDTRDLSDSTFDARGCQGGSFTYCNQPVQVGSDLTWTSISASQYSICGINDGKLYCWGKLQGVPTNFQLNQVGTLTNWTKVSHSDYHTCALNLNNKLYCWGNNSKGQLGIGNTEDKVIPTIVSGGYNWNNIVVGNSYTCGIVDEGALYCWGFNQYGQLGLGDSGLGTERNIPTRVGTQNWKAVAAGGDYTCGIDNLDKASCWGNNSNGELGLGSELIGFTVNIPAEVNNDLMVPYLNFYGKSKHTCSITSNKELYCWGDNDSRQLGIGDLNDSNNCALNTYHRGYCFNPVKVVIDNHNWSKFTTGGRSTCGVNNRELYCWGNNQYGQLGLGNDTPVYIPTLVTLP